MVQKLRLAEVHCEQLMVSVIEKTVCVGEPYRG